MSQSVPNSLDMTSPPAPLPDPTLAGPRGAPAYHVVRVEGSARSLHGAGMGGINKSLTCRNWTGHARDASNDTVEGGLGGAMQLAAWSRVRATLDRPRTRRGPLVHHRRLPADRRTDPVRAHRRGVEPAGGLAGLGGRHAHSRPGPRTAGGGPSPHDRRRPSPGGGGGTGGPSRRWKRRRRRHRRPDGSGPGGAAVVGPGWWRIHDPLLGQERRDSHLRRARDRPRLGPFTHVPRRSRQQDELPRRRGRRDLRRHSGTAQDARAGASGTWSGALEPTVRARHPTGRGGVPHLRPSPPTDCHGTST